MRYSIYAGGCESLKRKKLLRLLLLLILLGIIWNYFHPAYHIVGQQRSESGNLSELTLHVSVPEYYSEQRLARLKDTILSEQKRINYDLHTDIYHICFYLSDASSTPFREYLVYN